MEFEMCELRTAKKTKKFLKFSDRCSIPTMSDLKIAWLDVTNKSIRPERVVNEKGSRHRQKKRSGAAPCPALWKQQCTVLGSCRASNSQANVHRAHTVQASLSFFEIHK